MEHRDHLLTPLKAQVANVIAWNQKYGWGFDGDDIAGLHLDHEHPQRLTNANVVTTSLASVGATFDAWWQVIADIYDETRRFSEIKSDVDHLRVVEGIDFAPNQLDVVTLDLCAMRGTDDPARGEKRLVHFEALAAVAHFSEWVRRSDAWGLYMGGFRVRHPGTGFTDWSLVPSVHWVSGEETERAGGLETEDAQRRETHYSLVMSAGREGDPVPTAKWPVRVMD